MERGVAYLDDEPVGVDERSFFLGGSLFFVVKAGDVDSLQSPVSHHRLVKARPFDGMNERRLTALFVQSVFNRDYVRGTPLVRFLVLDAWVGESISSV